MSFINVIVSIFTTITASAPMMGGILGAVGVLLAIGGYWLYNWIMGMFV
ncbi:MAG: hypothetical protein LBC84_00580 [Prevotellaceae bacterium]|jgi:hypothetical protein|nr:hypothetical protein [Prevotellaceae bacterium]